MPKTRRNSFCEVFGSFGKLEGNVLPTNSDVMKYFLWNKELLKDNANGKDPSVHDISRIILSDLKSIWLKASIPVISDQRILSLIANLNEKYKNIKKNIKKCRGKMISFRENNQKTLFDISSCKCKNFDDCVCKIKVPKRERDFLIDQRTVRKMAIGSVDKKTSEMLQKNLERKTKEALIMTKFENSTTIKRNLIIDNTSENEIEEQGLSISNSVEKCLLENSERSTSFQVFKSFPTLEKRINLPNLAQACDRTGISDRSASLLVNAVLQDFQIITKENPANIIDRSKIRRERKKRRLELQEHFRSYSSVVRGLYFDGRKDKTIRQNQIGTKYYKKTVTEEHIVLVSEPGSIYLGHVTPTSGTARNITISIKTFLNNLNTNYNLDELKAVGCDGTVINTGITNGVVRQLEMFVGRPLQWHICLIHTNELPLRHLMHHLDGKTNDPKGFSGVIGRMLESCEKLSVVKFEPIAAQLPFIDSSSLSTDQKYLFDICTGISKGDIILSLSLRDPGNMSHSRWLTTANRILRLYVGVADPSIELKILAQYVIQVYASTWFEIKEKPTCEAGSKHFFGMIKKTRYLPENLKNIVDPVLQRNAYFAHSENVLLSMLTDERIYIRELALRRILKCRTYSEKQKTIRVFKVPELNFNAGDYVDMIDWQCADVAEPPLTKHISTVDLEQMILNIPDDFDILKLPCHSQAVERSVKLVSETSSLVCGEEARDGVIRAKLVSQNELPKFDTKKQFVSVLK